MLFDKEIQVYLSSAKLVEAKDFYKNKLGLMLLRENKSLLEFRSNGILLRIQIVDEVRPQPTIVLGWRVKEISEVIKFLDSRNILFEEYGLGQMDKLGGWNSFNGLKMICFKDPDGNILSISEEG